MGNEKQDQTKVAKRIGKLLKIYSDTLRVLLSGKIKAKKE